ncbi:hypothetical protein TRVL_08490 [Trypanosoma vivax]|uniref:Uncharacterized protein n=1 Tax=Trypanosoma vivax (strain Y486) TaxID=1055687 RepID=G0TUW5_TRYVY|nr:hypothetical protein TRVL_08490 [Trypanosoma vivax]CCC47752.1 conserved hypothetical protein [Trypanosoma vivax Y486]
MGTWCRASGGGAYCGCPLCRCGPTPPFHALLCCVVRDSMACGKPPREGAGPWRNITVPYGIGHSAALRQCCRACCEFDRASGYPGAIQLHSHGNLKPLVCPARCHDL